MPATPALFVSFYTPAYETEARGLLLSLDDFGLFDRADVRSMPDSGSWLKNCAAKAEFVRAMMREHPDTPLVWLDADARVRQAPVLFDTMRCDFAAHRRKSPDWPQGELLSGTMYFSGSEASVDLVEDWMAECQRHPDTWDQVCLDNVLRHLPGLSMTELPAPYTCIFDADPPMGPAVIEHLQASRRLRRD